MPTPISSAAPYATVADFIARYDVRVVLDLCSDGQYKPSQADIQDVTTPAGLKLYTALQDASGNIETACFVGGRYSTTDLAALTGNGLARLKLLVCQLALDRVNRRRCDPNYDTSKEVQEALTFLDALSEGDRIFGLQEAADAGVTEIDVESAATVEARNMISFQASRLLGTRSNRR